MTLYTRQGCRLCDEARVMIEKARRRVRFELDVVDIDRDPALRSLYNEEVPVIAIDGREAFRHRVTLDEFLEGLAGR